MEQQGIVLSYEAFQSGLIIKFQFIKYLRKICVKQVIQVETHYLVLSLLNPKKADTFTYQTDS